MPGDEITTQYALNKVARWSLGDKRLVIASEIESTVIRVNNRSSSKPLENFLPLDFTANLIANLMNGIANAYLATIPEPDIKNSKDYACALAANYEIVSTIEDTLRLAERRALRFKQNRLADFFSKALTAESGHAALIQMDLKDLGYELSEFNFDKRVSLARQIAENLRSLANSDQPVAILGIGYLLERNALEIGADFLRSAVSLPSDSGSPTKFFDVHSGVGEEPDHLEHLISFMGTLDTFDLRSVLTACEENAALMALASSDATARY